MGAQRKHAVLVAILSLLLATCGQPDVSATLGKATETPKTPPRSTLTIEPSAPSTVLPYPPFSPPPSPMPVSPPPPSSTPTPSPVPSPTPIYPAYAGAPFTIIFLRAGNLWLAEVGGGSERQLTAESTDWPVTDFAISPEGDRVAYVIYRGPPSLDAVVKQVQISSGRVSVLAGENDQCSEYGVKWLDATHIAFRFQEYAVQEHSDSSCFPEDVQREHVVLDLTTGERTSVPESLHLSQSPNGRYWLTCSCNYTYECSCQYVLHDLVTGQDTPVAENLDWANFLGWSPDAQSMLFTTGSGLAMDHPVLQLAIIDVATRETRVITPDDRVVTSAAWSPTGRVLAFTQCQSDDDSSFPSMTCILWLADQQGANLQPIPVGIPPTYVSAAMCLTWTPDGSRLVFALPGPAPNTHAIWTVRLDGTDLRPIVIDADHVCYAMRQQP